MLNDKVHIDFDNVCIPIDLREYLHSSKIKIFTNGNQITQSTCYLVRKNISIKDIKQWKEKIYKQVETGLSLKNYTFMKEYPSEKSS